MVLRAGARVALEKEEAVCAAHREDSGALVSMRHPCPVTLAKALIELHP